MLGGAMSERVDNAHLAVRLERLRANRARARDATITAAVGELQRELRRARRRSGAVDHLAEAWREIVPPTLWGRCEPSGLARGVLTVLCEDGGARYELDRWLRGGGREELVRACGASVRRVRLTLRPCEPVAAAGV